MYDSHDKGVVGGDTEPDPVCVLASRDDAGFVRVRTSALGLYSRAQQAAFEAWNGLRLPQFFSVLTRIRPQRPAPNLYDKARATWRAPSTTVPPVRFAAVLDKPAPVPAVLIKRSKI